MGFLRRVLGGGGDKAPGWAPYMSAEEYRAFEAAVLEDLQGRGYSTRLTGDGGVETTGGANPGVYGLFNLAQVCHANDRGDWPNLIRGHFGMLEANAAAAGEPMDLATARPLLRIRMFRVADTQPELLANIVKRELAPDLVGALAVDLPTTVRTCTDDDIEHWGIPADEAFEIATANLAEEMRSYVRERIDVPTGGAVEVMLGDTFFVPSQIVRFREIVGGLERGALVTLPNRHHLAWHAIESVAGTVNAVNALLNLASTAYAEGPGSLTPDLYWWRSGALTHLPGWVDRKGIQFAPTDEFLELLNGLS